MKFGAGRRHTSAGTSARASLNAEDVEEEEIPVGTNRRSVLRRDNLPEENGGRCVELCYGKRGGAVFASLGGVRLPLDARRRRRLGTAYAVGAKAFVLFGSDALMLPLTELIPVSCGRLRDVTFVS